GRTAGIGHRQLELCGAGNRVQSPRIKYTSKIKGVAVLLVFFENGHPPWALPGLKPLHLAANFGLIFTFRKREFQFYDFFLGLMIFTFVGSPRLFLWAGPSSLVRCFQELPLFMHWIPPIPTGQRWLRTFRESVEK